MSKLLETEVILPASPDEVWAVLMDFPSYPRWNPFVVEIAGTPIPGNTLSVRLSPPGGKSMRFTPTVKVCEPGRHFAWLGHLLVPGIFDGEHNFELEPLADGRTRLRHFERFGGVLVPFLGKMLDGSTRAGFEAMNQALRERLAARGA